jgi:hypothetical protein
MHHFGAIHDGLEHGIFHFFLQIVSLGQLLMMLLIFLVDARRVAPILRLVCLSPNYV